MCDWDNISSSTDDWEQASSQETDSQLESFRQAALKEAVEEARLVLQENDPVHIAGMRAGRDSGEYKIARWVCARIASDRDKMYARMHQERDKVRSFYEREMAQIEEEAKREAFKQVQRQRSGDYERSRVSEAEEALAAAKETADRRILAAERVLAAEREVVKAKLLLERYNDERAHKIRRFESSSERVSEAEGFRRGAKRSYDERRSQEEEDRRDAYEMRKIREFERIKSDLFAAYKIDRSMRNTLTLDRAMAADPYPARRLLGHRPRDEFHRLRIQRNTFAHSEQ